MKPSRKGGKKGLVWHDQPVDRKRVRWSDLRESFWFHVWSSNWGTLEEQLSSFALENLTRKIRNRGLSVRKLHRKWKLNRGPLISQNENGLDAPHF